MKHLLLFSFCSVILMGCKNSVDDKKTRVVTTHNHVTIVTNPSEGKNYFPSWGIFPSKEEKIRRVYMNVILGYPDSIKIAHWDYLDFITIRRVGGMNGKSLDLELGRMLTPYGSNFKQDWKWRWRIDVTDYANLIRDSVEIEYLHSGYESKEVGWDLTVSFEFLLGEPVAKFISYTPLYKGDYSYGNPETPVNELLEPIEVTMDNAAEIGRIRIQHTGHGMDPPKFCSEFCSRWRKVLVDGKIIDFRDMWKECGDNNLFPQGGTWIFDRAYWCPGDLQKPDLIDFPIIQSKHIIEFEIEPYSEPGSIRAHENINAVLFQYEKPVNEFDVAVEEILVPNCKPELNRLNPSCFNPRVVIRNLGSETLQSLIILYGTEGFGTKSYTWNGELEFYQEEIVVLPDLVDFFYGENVFFTKLSNPNGKKDQWGTDNLMHVNFLPPKEMPERMVLTYKSNNDPDDNTIQVVDQNKKVVYERTPETTKADTIYKDTLLLPAGRYRITLQDTAHNGLEFWFMPQHGFGYMYLSDLEGRILHRFESDCGVGEQLDFSTRQNPRIDSTVGQSFFILHPRIVTGKTQLMVNLAEPSDGKIHVLADGEIIKTLMFMDVKNKIFDIALEDIEDGRYVIELFVEGESKLKQRISKITRKKE